MEKIRCGWCLKSELETAYHDQEWGVPRFDDAGQFEFITLEAAQAGLSWSTILKKREGYREAFANFDPHKVATFTQADVEHLMGNPGIVRNRKKIESAIKNARLFLELAAKYGSFANWFWAFTDGKSIQNTWKELAQIPATTPLSDTIAKECKRLGFSFLGSTVLYAHMQATGMVNDHLTGCFRHKEVEKLGR
ncbi:DNA-3-methyladenine glycosylase I [Desulfovibrio sp. OttesenSCG-928-G15]|nr:DNA-3-methyladenine glycosylase I [Desulfovibrio sp. OttesenSCG-928-G15]